MLNGRIKNNLKTNPGSVLFNFDRKYRLCIFLECSDTLIDVLTQQMHVYVKALPLLLFSLVKTGMNLRTKYFDAAYSQFERYSWKVPPVSSSLPCTHGRSTSLGASVGPYECPAKVTCGSAGSRLTCTLKIVKTSTFRYAPETHLDFRVWSRSCCRAYIWRH